MHQVIKIDYLWIKGKNGFNFFLCLFCMQKFCGLAVFFNKMVKNKGH